MHDKLEFSFFFVQVGHTLSTTPLPFDLFLTMSKLFYQLILLFSNDP